MPSYDPDVLSALFEQAAALAPDERAAYIDKACHGDEVLRETLASLLVSADAASGYFDDLGQRVIAPALVAFADETAEECQDRPSDPKVRVRRSSPEHTTLPTSTAPSVSCTTLRCLFCACGSRVGTE